METHITIERIEWWLLAAGIDVDARVILAARTALVGAGLEVEAWDPDAQVRRDGAIEEDDL